MKPRLRALRLDYWHIWQTRNSQIIRVQSVGVMGLPGPAQET